MSDTEWLDAEQQRIWRALLGGTTVLLDRLDRDLRSEHGISMPEYEILVRLSESEDRRIRLAALHEAGTFEACDGVGDPAAGVRDRGGELTDDGFALLERAAHTHVRGVQDYLVKVSDPDDFRALGRVMEGVRTTLDGRPF